MPHEGVVLNIFSTTLLLYCSAICPQGMTCKYGLEGRLGCIALSYLGVLLEIVVWIYDTFDNNLGIENLFAKYLKSIVSVD